MSRAKAVGHFRSNKRFSSYLKTQLKHEQNAEWQSSGLEKYHYYMLKKATYKKLNNYHSNCSHCSLSVFTKIITNRIQITLDSNQPQQVGICSGYYIVKHHQCSLNYCMIFIDHADFQRQRMLGDFSPAVDQLQLLLIT